MFSFFVVGSNIFSNIFLARSTFSLYFLQMAYQLSHAYQDANNFTKHHHWSFLDFSTAYDCFNYSQCQASNYAGIGCSVILIIISIAVLRSNGQIKTLLATRSCDCIFLLTLSVFEWVLLPSISNTLYLYSNFSEKMLMILGSFATLLSLIAMVISVRTLRKQFTNEIDEKDGTYF